MTSLLRCRAAMSELRERFGAEPRGTLSWRPVIWPGEPVLIVGREGEERWIETSRWEYPGAHSLRRSKPRGVLYPREAAEWIDGRLPVSGASRCLILLESFAYPGGERSRRTRSWAGLWDEPICAWAAVRVRDARGQSCCAGLLVRANPLLSRVTPYMPALLAGEAAEVWLRGIPLVEITTSYRAEAFYLEDTDDLWSTGASLDPAP